MTISDARIGAWFGSWKRIEAAQKLITDKKGVVNDPLPEVYWALLAEAQIYARLATAEMTIGVSVGMLLQDEVASEFQKREDIEAFLNRDSND